MRITKFLLLFSLFCLPAFWTLAGDTKPPLNVLFISIDDLNDWVGFLGGHSDTVTQPVDLIAFFPSPHCFMDTRYDCVD